ncbi:hypothetical protein CC80DRAFT_499541 [Byssothecium circinans]|uniref:C2H2-type domain-containing protein n=1 Tax=Byssothecium circinans TaxID=147558 RepID=A0A6A5UB28_9PLEO|nr:hypothetical protein CC80DRAFT_499541 [Byssothecium circinans]
MPLSSGPPRPRATRGTAPKRCTKTFTRVPDLNRHRNSVHHLETQFWCTVAGCSRSEAFLGQKRPFPRKDKLNSHVKTVHKAIVSPTESSDYLGTGSPAAGGLDWLDGFNSFTDIGGSTSIDGFASFGGLTSVGGFDNAHGFASMDGFPNIEGLNAVGGCPFVSEFNDAHGFVNSSRLTGDDEVDYMDGSAGIEWLPGVDDFMNFF